MSATTFLTLADFNIGDKVQLVGGKLIGTVVGKTYTRLQIQYGDRITEAYPAEVRHA